MDINQLLNEFTQCGASDLHLASGHVPTFQISGDKTHQSKQTPVTEVDIQEIIKHLLSAKQIESLKHGPVCCTNQVSQNARFRIHVLQQGTQTWITLRLIPVVVPTIETLHLPAALKKLCNKAPGLVLVTGPKTSGLSTTVAAMLTFINSTEKNLIATIENPIEFLDEDHLSRYMRMEVQEHVGWTPLKAFHAMLPHAPDTIFSSDLSQPDLLHASLRAAEAGCLVIGIMNTESCKETLDHIFMQLPPSDFAVNRLSKLLKGVISQRLLKRCDRPGQVAAVEILLNSPYIQKVIQSRNTRHLERAMLERSAEYEMQTLTIAIYSLWKKGLISKDTAFAASTEPDDLRLMIRGIARNNRKDDGDSLPSTQVVPAGAPFR